MSALPADIPARPQPAGAATAPAPAAATLALSPGRARWVLLMVTLVYTVNFVDRNILNVLLQPIKQEFQLSDAMLGFMSGIGFTALYVLASLPLARLADRGHRVGVIATCLTLWSAMTALCGLAGSAVQLVLARCAVAVGEAGSGGPGQALLADVFPPAQRTRAMSFLATATFLGVTLAFTLGSAINRAAGWRMAFILVGLPGLLLSLLFWFTLRKLPKPAATPGRAAVSVGQALRFLLGQRSVVLGTLAFCATSFASAAITAWVTPMLQRVHGLSNLEAGLKAGPILGGAGILGGLLAATVMTRLCRRDMRWTLWANAISLLVAAPAMLAFCLAPSAHSALAALAVVTLCSGFQIGPFVAALQSAVLVRVRATAGALNMAATTLFGWGLGPLAVGLLSDALLPTLGNDSLRYAMMLGPLALLLGAVLAMLAARHLPRDIAAVA